ncbi:MULTISPECIES: sigma-54-dependent transcriptional regulator [Clostridioides]|uniref:sigma 54-interacting transcriptional regulator n=1 Tax=Clostridioides sp. ZZV14-6387 TaxID=2811497 RepID=UPI0007BC6160|nr:Regulatory protein LuxO [Clostridioides difficile]CZS07249.1 Regulatory protein LuxO [Clostridioides difficile]
MIYKKDKVMEVLKALYRENGKGITANRLSEKTGIARNNISTYLNQLFNEGMVTKIKGKPVYYVPANVSINEEELLDIEKEIKIETKIKKDSFETLIGKTQSLRPIIEKCKVAMLYPTNGLHTIIYGETGVGKSMIARYMYDYSIDSGIREDKAPFITFNCADYANNPQLLMGHVFGVEQGAYTGAESSRKGLLEIANGGILFLDEIHRLPAEGQEMLFTFIDKGTFKRLGDATKERESEVLIICATTENPTSTLLDTFNRRIPMKIEIPSLRNRTMIERMELVKNFFKQESKSISISIKVHREIIKSLLLYDCKNNVGQLQNDIKLAVANGYLRYKINNKEPIYIEKKYFDKSINEVNDDYRDKSIKADEVITHGIEFFLFTPFGEEEIINYNMNIINAVNSNLNESVEMNIADNSLFNDVKFKNMCKVIRQIIKEDEEININESIFRSMAIYIKNVLDKNNSTNNIDLNQIRRNNRSEFRTALKIVGIIENEFDLFLSIETVAYITLFIVQAKQDEQNKIMNNFNIIVTMHGETTASSMVKAVSDIIGECNAISFDMKLDKSYERVIIDFKRLINNIDNKDILLFTDMGSLNSFDEIIKNEKKCDVRVVPMVTTLTVLEAVQKANMGLSLNDVYNSIVNTRKYYFGANEIQNKENLSKTIIIASHVSEGVDNKTRKILEEKMNRYLDGIDIISVPYKTEKDLSLNIAKLKESSNVVALINEQRINVKGIDYVSKKDIDKDENINKLKNIIKISIGYDDVVEGLRTSLKNSNYNRIFKDIKSVSDELFLIFNVEKKYDKVIGLMMHLAFMVDGLIGNTRAIEQLD